MNIHIKMTRTENIARFGTGTVVLEIEDYLCGVVPAEIYESSHMDALKAQAIVARTYALKRALAGTVLTDTSANQAYKYPLAQSCPRSRQAVMETQGMVLCYDGKVIDCFYSASNGGVTKCSGDVWSKHYPYYVSKIDAWDIAANREKPTKASHGIGMSQIGAGWAAKNGVPFTSILAFYYEGTAIATAYGDGGFLLPESPVEPEGPTETEEVPISLVMHERIMTRNDSYAYGRKIAPTGIMVHSTATPGIMAAAWFDRWNKSYKAGETSRQVSVHAFLDDQEVWQYLPWDQRGWHSGGKANDSCIGFEICEPKGHRYESGGKMVNYDVQKNESYFRAVWKNATLLCVMLCQRFGISPDNIIGHYEGYKKGLASNHADPGHWFPMHDESMDTFRAAVRALLNDGSIAVPKPSPNPSPETNPNLADDYVLYTVKAGDTLWSIARDRMGTGTRYREIMALNDLVSDTIRIGQILHLPE